MPQAKPKSKPKPKPKPKPKAKAKDGGGGGSGGTKSGKKPSVIFGMRLEQAEGSKAKGRKQKSASNLAAKGGRRLRRRSSVGSFVDRGDDLKATESEKVARRLTMPVEVTEVVALYEGEESDVGEVAVHEEGGADALAEGSLDAKGGAAPATATASAARRHADVLIVTVKDPAKGRVLTAVVHQPSGVGLARPQAAGVETAGVPGLSADTPPGTILLLDQARLVDGLVVRY